MRGGREPGGQKTTGEGEVQLQAEQRDNIKDISKLF